MSLAEEIGKLYELHKMDVLSAEEFKSAKEAAIRRFSGAPVTAPEIAVAPAPQPTFSTSGPEHQQQQQQQQQEQPPSSDPSGVAPPPSISSPTTSAVYPLLEPIVQEEMEQAAHLFPLVNVSMLLRYAAVAVCHSTSDYTRALDHLARICGNILGQPDHTKFHQLRLTNPKLASELFPVPGAVPFLCSVGFDLFSETGELLTGEAAVDSEGRLRKQEGWLRWRAAEERRLLPRLERATTSLSFLREREDGVTKHRIDLQRLSQSLSNGHKERNVALDIRLEQARAAAQGGTLVPHTVQLFTKDDAGDGLYSATKHAELLAALCEHAAHIASGSPDKELTQKALWLPLDSPGVFAAVVQQKGSLEFLLTNAQAVLRPLPVTTEASAAAGPSALVPHVPIGLHFASLDTAVLTSSAEAARAVADAVAHTRQSRDNEARKAAEAVIKVDRRREKLRQAHANDVAEARRRDGQLPRRHRHEAGNEEANESSDSSDEGTGNQTSGASGAAAAGSGKRVPLSEALALLMGRKREDDW